MKIRHCIWRQDDYDEVWWGGCEIGWCFNDGGPKENSMAYCPGCGNPIKIKGEK